MTDQIDKDAQNTHELTARVARALIARGWRLTTAESCTGGNLAAALCAQADTAAFYDTGVVTFSDEAKRNVLQVRAETLAVHSAVSEACVQEMSTGILTLAGPISPSPSAAMRGRKEGRMELPPGRYGLHGTFAARSKPNGCALPVTARQWWHKRCASPWQRWAKNSPTGSDATGRCALTDPQPGALPARESPRCHSDKAGRTGSPETGECQPTVASTTPPGFQRLPPRP
ncbi:protein Implicated in DNA repair function with RecA and MutS [Klebsiella quasipneumoniae]|nr:protein Implicated in DNA repair function with RecA and MutS [Klebsiella quasipneumoniae]